MPKRPFDAQVLTNRSFGVLVVVIEEAGRGHLSTVLARHLGEYPQPDRCLLPVFSGAKSGSRLLLDQSPDLLLHPPDGRGLVDADTARERLQAERAEIKRMLSESEAAVGQNRSAENEQSDADDRAQPLTAEGIDDAVAASLRDRLAALDRAEQRLTNGTYGLSIRSGVPIAHERLDADPAAELTIDEARGGHYEEETL